MAGPYFHVLRTRGTELACRLVFVDCSALIAEAKLQLCLVSDLCTLDARSSTGMTGVEVLQLAGALCTVLVISRYHISLQSR